MKRGLMLWVMGILSVVVTVILIACGTISSNTAALHGYADAGPEKKNMVQKSPQPKEELWIVPTTQLTVGSGDGHIVTQSGTGALVLNGANTFSGPLSVNGGTLTTSSGIAVPGSPPSTSPAGGRGAAPGGPGVQFERPAPTPEAAFPLPGSPILAAKLEGQYVPVPLKHTDVSAQITGYIASVGVTQQFTNPYAEKIEAVYVFPLPENAGINEFVMTIGERHIRGIIREREEAQRIYDQAKSQGYTASLMTQERPNIFTQSVANIEPGKQIDVSVRYFHTLTYQDGWFEWVFPMVVGPRYNPAGTTNGFGAVAQNARGASGQKTEIQYLRPEQRSGHDISLKVNLDAGVDIEDLVSVNHHIIQPKTRAQGASSRSIELSPEDALPNKDFVLRYKVAGNKVKTGMFVQKDKDGKGGWFTMMLIPPAELKDIPRRGLEMVFVVDTSGSMSGQPITQAKKAVDVALSKMEPRDTFQIVKFDSTAGQMSPTAVPVTPENIAAAHQYVAQMQGGGGTEMLKGMNAALDFPHDENRTRVVAFLTDGYIGNEMQILRALHDRLLDSRVFSFGVGSSPNRYLLDAMARLGHGSAAYLSLNEPAEPVMDTYFERTSHPALANIKLSFPGMKVSDVYPQRIPELFVGRPVILTGRFTGTPSGNVTLAGRIGDTPVSYQIPALGTTEEHAAISTVWAGAKLTDLHDESIYEGRDVLKDVKDTALTYGIMSEVTSFVAVDSTRVTAGDHGTTVAVPVPVPDGVRYETTVQER